MTIDNVISKWKRLKGEIKTDPVYKDASCFRIKPLDMNLLNPFYMSANINQKLLIYIEFPDNDTALSILSVNENDTIIIYSQNSLIKIPCSDVPTVSKIAQGNHVAKYGNVNNINII